MLLPLPCRTLQIFLSLRIIEFRNAGYSDVESVKRGFAFTAGSITTAGVIMVIAFGCLMMSTQQLLAECGFFIAFSILFDTFVVRTIIVPCVMVMLGPMNWWPKVMPPISRFGGSERVGLYSEGDAVDGWKGDVQRY